LTFDAQARYDRLSQRYIVTAENGSTPNRIFIAVSNTPSITSATAWTFFFFDISLVSPAGDSTCFADYPTTGVDANALIIGVNNFCPTSYASSAVFVVRKSSITSAGPIVVTAFRNVGQVTPRGIDNWDPDPAGTASSYFMSIGSTTQLRLRRITSPGGTPVLSGALNVTIPTVAPPISLEHLGNAHPGGVANGKVDGNDTRIMPSMIRNGSLWAMHGTGVNNAGVASAVDRDAARWYEITDLDTTPTLAQSGTIFDSAASNPLSYTYPTMGVSSQGHAVFGFSVIGAAQFNSAGYTTRLASDVAGFANAPVAYANGIGAYNAFDLGTSRAQRWGDYSRTVPDPCDDMTIWTAQEFTAQANTAGSSNAQWGIQVAQVRAPPPAQPVSTGPASVLVGQASVNVILTGTSASGSGFYDTPATNTDACRTRIAAAIPGVIVNSVTYDSPTQVTLNVSTVGATLGAKNVTVTNPDGQSATGTGIFTVTAPVSPPALQSVVLRRVHGAAGTFDLPLSLVAPLTVNHNPTTEPRTGPTHQLVYTYDKPLNNATVNVTEGTAVKSSSLVGSTVVVDLTGATNAQYVTVSLTNVGSTDGGTGGIGEARVGLLQGDVNQSRVVSLADLGLVNAQLAQLVTAANFLKDVNASGTLTLADKGITNANLTTALPAP
jgi:hypothetical protein